jgi:hypothetical protein
LSYEVELLALAVLFYLYDSSVLLYSNEAILTYDRAQRWTATTGWIGFVLAGRSLCLLNPFTPYRPSFRLGWDFSRLEPETQDREWPKRAQQFKRIAPLTVTAGIALFLLLPLGMFTEFGRYAVISAVVLLYGSILLALFQLRRKQIPAAVGLRHFWGFAFECLACPPFAVNMIRRITLRDRIAEPLPLAAVRLLDADRWAELRDRCISRIDEAIQRVGEDSHEQKALEAQKQRLSILVSSE